MRTRFIFIYIALLFLCSSLNAQENKTDSLNKIFFNTKLHDTIRLNAINEIAWYFVFSNPDTAINLATQAASIANKKNLLFWEAKAFNTVGVSYFIMAKYDDAEKFFLKSIAIKEKINDKIGLAASMTNIGSLNFNKGNFEKALDYYFKSLKIEQAINHYTGIAQTYNDIGLIFEQTAEYTNKDFNYKKALNYYGKALAISKKYNQKYTTAAVYGNMGNIYSDLLDYNRALHYHAMSLSLRKEINDLQGEAASYGNIGNVYLHMKNKGIEELKLNNNKNIHLAIENYFKCYEIMEKIHDLNGLSLSLTNLGHANLRLGNNIKAYQFAKEALKYSEDLNLIELKRDNHQILAEITNRMKKYDESVYHYKNYILFQDSLNNEENKKDIARKEMQFEYEKKTLSDSIKHAQEKNIADAKLATRDAQIKQEKTFKIALITGLVLLIVFAIFIYNRFRITRHQKIIIENQKLIVEEKNNAILDSINYAKRLQDAILPPDKLWKSAFPKSFILYKPKDIVAGDFYFLEKSGNKLIFAVADCTGHGVPGAMVSVVCANALNRTVKEFKITEPGKLLDKVRELVLETYERSESDVNDGMDISICVIDTNSFELSWAGANNPLWIYREDEKNNFIELKPDKQPIGKIFDYKPFTTHQLKLQKNDFLLLFTDGYADQFGGPLGKKYKYANLQKLILSNLNVAIEKLNTVLDKELTEWQGSLEQVDDICVIGVRL